MEFESDILEDSLLEDAPKAAKAGAKFQPKSKPKPVPRKLSAPVPPNPSVSTRTVADNKSTPVPPPQSAQAVTITDKESVSAPPPQSVQTGDLVDNQSIPVNPPQSPHAFAIAYNKSALVPPTESAQTVATKEPAAVHSPLSISAVAVADDKSVSVHTEQSAQAVAIAENEPSPVPPLESVQATSMADDISISMPPPQSVQTVAFEYSELADLAEQEESIYSGSVLSGDTYKRSQQPFGKSVGESADQYIGLENYGDSYPHLTTVTESSTHVSSDGNADEGLATHVFSDGNADEGLVRSELSNVPNTCAHPGNLMHQSALTIGEDIIFGIDEDFHIEQITTGTEDPEDLLIGSGPRAGKYPPKPKAQVHKSRADVNIPNPGAMETDFCPEEVPLETEFTDGRSTLTFPTDDIPDYSSYVFNDELTFCNETEEPIISNETSHSPEPFLEMPKRSTKKRNRKTSALSGPLMDDIHNDNSSCADDQIGRSSGRRRKPKTTLQLVDESEDDSLDVDYVPSIVDDGNVGNENVESGSKKPTAEKARSTRKRKKGKEDDSAKASTKMLSHNVDHVPGNVNDDNVFNKNVDSGSKEPVGEKERPPRKRKKGKEDDSSKTSTKKFSHSTRRNKRRVNPEFLKIPEDEIDLHNMPLKDVIRLAEYRERNAKNGSTTIEALSRNEGTSNSHYDNYDADASRDYDDEYEDFASRDYADESENHMVQDVTHVNYRTHMKITPRGRWSKQDTELFYEAVQQFGSDMSMIKERFPGRTREQIKSKFKKEERQNPARLHDAMTTRSKDHSHFQLVIERLKQEAAERQDSEQDDTTNWSDEEAEDATADINEWEKTDEQFGKPEQFDKEIQDEEQNGTKVENTVDEDDDDEDYSLWSQYKSEI